VAFPENLGRLRRIRRLGAGGFASVWLYHDAELDSPVAVKALADNWAQDPAIRTRFVEESRLLRRASSDHVVSVHDVGVTADDIPYFVMTYADRGSAADLIAGGRRPRRTSSSTSSARRPEDSPTCMRWASCTGT
jgi:serine/threonine protein kinase